MKSPLLMIVVALLELGFGVKGLGSPAEPMIWNVQSLEFTRQAVERLDSRWVPAYRQLLKDADKALEIKRLSVIDKTGPVPSGDPHDYVSIGIYWWPNPNTENGLPYVRRDGERNPEANNDTFDAHRTAQMANAVQTLALAWHFSGEPEYAEHAVHLVRIFFLNPETRMNPNLNYGQAIPGREEGRGIGIIETGAWVYLIDAFILLQSSLAWGEPEEAGMQEWFRNYLSWLLNSRNGVSCRMEMNNIGIWYDSQVIAYALFTGQQELARGYYLTVALPRVMALIEPDGRMPSELRRTRSWSYTLYTLRALCNLASMSRHMGEDMIPVQGQSGQSLGKAMAYPLSYLKDLQSWPHPQMGGGLGAGIYGQIAAQAVEWYGEEKFGELRKLAESNVAMTSRSRLLFPQLFLNEETGH